MRPEEQQALDLGPQTPARLRPPSGFDVARCRYCKARILWAALIDQWTGAVKRRENGDAVKLPLNPVPQPDGQLRIYGEGRVIHIARSEVVLIGERWARHSCPEGEQARKRRRARR